MIRHDNLVRCLGQLAARNLDPRPRLEQIVPELAQPVHKKVGQSICYGIWGTARMRAFENRVALSSSGINRAFWESPW